MQKQHRSTTSIIKMQNCAASSHAPLVSRCMSWKLAIQLQNILCTETDSDMHEVSHIHGYTTHFLRNECRLVTQRYKQLRCNKCFALRLIQNYTKFNTRHGYLSECCRLKCTEQRASRCMRWLLAIHLQHILCVETDSGPQSLTRKSKTRTRF